jgi:hypothetical protein
MSDRPVAIDLYPGTGLPLAGARHVVVDCEQAGFEGLWTLEAGTELFLPLALVAEHSPRRSGRRDPPPLRRCPRSRADLPALPESARAVAHGAPGAVIRS